jgi:hypothetical protein
MPVFEEELHHDEAVQTVVKKDNYIQYIDYQAKNEKKFHGWCRVQF